jgi:hypothetical protein
MYEHRRPLWTTDAQRALLIEMIDQWVEQAADAKDMTIEDPTVQTADDLLDLMASYDNDVALLKDVREQCERPRPQRRRFFPGRKS